MDPSCEMSGVFRRRKFGHRLRRISCKDTGHIKRMTYKDRDTQGDGYGSRDKCCSWVHKGMPRVADIHQKLEGKKELSLQVSEEPALLHL